MLLRLTLPTFTKKIALFILASAVAVVVAISPQVSAIAIGGPSDCDANAVIRCGAHSTAALKQAYESQAYVRRAFHILGISASDMTLISNAQVGRVTSGGKVFIEGRSRAVATNALTGGRQNISGSSAVTYHGSTLYTRPPSVSFQSASLPAYVVMHNGHFLFAVIASCGNPVKATPTVVHTTNAPKPAPTPRPTPPAPAPAPAPAAPAAAPVQQQAQAQQQSVVVEQEVTQNAAPAQAPAATPTPAAPVAAPEALPNTGPAGVAGLFALSSIGGFLGYRRYLMRHSL